MPRPLRSRQDVHVDVRLATYCVSWPEKAALPQAVLSRGYVEHVCEPRRR